MGRVEQIPTSRSDSKAPCREGVPVAQAEMPKVTNICRSLNPTEMVWWAQMGALEGYWLEEGMGEQPC